MGSNHHPTPQEGRTLEPIRLTVIECDNPDDQYTDARHLKLVHLPPSAAPTVESIPRPLLRQLADAMIGYVTNIWWSLESWRNRLADRRSETGRDSQPTIVAGRRNW